MHGSDYTYKELLESGSGDGLSAQGKLVSYRMGANREYRKETMAMVDLETRSSCGLRVNTFTRTTCKIYAYYAYVISVYA